MSSRSPTRPATQAYVLLEIIVALTVFALVVGGLASVLHGSLDSANTLRRTATIRRGMEALLVEARLKPKREEMALTATDESLGIEYRSSLEELKWINRRGQPVRGLYILRVEARDQRASPLNSTSEPTDSAEIYVYRP